MSKKPIPRIFVSATTSDLKEYRDAVKAKLVDREVLPVSQESFQKSDYRSVKAVIESKMDRADAIIHIVGQSFGRSLKPEEKEKISYTQYELKYADQKGLPVFLFLSDDALEFDSLCEEDWKQEKQQQYREIVRKRTELRSTFSSIEDLANQIASLELTDLIEVSKREERSRSTYEFLTDYIRDRFLLSRNLELIESRTSRESFSKLFHLIAKIDPSEKRDLDYNEEKDFFKILADHIVTSRKETPLSIRGYSGCGKSTCLNFLYYYFHEQYIQKPKEKPLPVYIDLSVNSLWISTSSVIGETEGPSAILEFHALVDRVKAALPEEGGAGTIFLIDGFDEQQLFRPEDASVVFSEIDRVPGIKKIIGLQQERHDHRSLLNSGIRMEADEKLSADVTIVLAPTKGDSKVLKEVIHHYLTAVGGASDRTLPTPEQLLTKLKSYDINEIDLFALSLVCDNWDMAKQEKGIGLIGLMDRHILKQLEERSEGSETVLRGAALEAYNDFMGIENKRQGDELLTLLSLIRSHTTVRDYLVAKYLCEDILEDEQKAKSMTRVYPSGINRFCKLLVNATDTRQTAIFRLIKNNWEQWNDWGRSHAFYLLGRFVKQSVANDAKEFLSAYVEKYGKGLLSGISDGKPEAIEDSPGKVGNPKMPTSDQIRQRGLLGRTCYISLACLDDDDDSSGEYILKLIKNKRCDELNRGFHLEYYGDIPYLVEESHLSVEDDLKADFELTLNRLSSKINHSLETGQTHRLFWIEIYTLCSLAIYRMAASTLERDRHLEIHNLVVATVEKFGDEMNPWIRAYLLRMQQFLPLGNDFTVLHPIIDLYRLKQWKRQGWLERGRELDEKKVESVADHCLLTLLLAQFLIPDGDGSKEARDEKSYKMQTLLFHDIGEAIVGDIVNKTEEQREAEMEAVMSFAVLRAFPGLYPSENLFELFDSFEKRNTKEHKECRDLDLLENILQLKIYEQDKDCFSDEKEGKKFESSLLKSLNTSNGKQWAKMASEIFGRD